MENVGIVTGCCLVVMAAVGGLAVAVEPYLTAGEEMALLTGALVAVGMPLFAIWTYWWVNESVYRSGSRRPSGTGHRRYR